MNNIFLDLLLSLILGILIGIERGARKERETHEIVGIRTFALIGLFGGISAYIGVKYNASFIIISFFSLSLFLLILYIMELKIQRGVGITTVMAAFITYSLGVLVIFGEKTLAIALAVVVTLLLSLKPRLHYLIKKIDEAELYAILKLLLITVVVLPLLPDKGYGPGEFFNPYRIWFFVILIAGISFVGYIFAKLFGQERGFILTSVFGGIASSTALTLNYARIGRKEECSNLLTLGILISWFLMFPRIFIIAIIINIKLLTYLLLPFITLSMVLFIFALVYWFKSNEKKILNTNLIIFNNPLQLKPALEFGLLLVAIMFLTYLFRIYFGRYGIYAIAVISGITDVDAITLTVTSLSKTDLGLQIAANAILLASIINTIVKGLFVVFISHRVLKKNIIIVILIFLLVSLGYFILNEVT
jgi:uncharacterized membrane protein (DUF4010 family)